jgi:hypothetical protein
MFLKFGCTITRTLLVRNPNLYVVIIIILINFFYIWLLSNFDLSREKIVCEKKNKKFVVSNFNGQDQAS